MKNERNFFKCSICGKIVGLIEDGGGALACCGKDMEQLLPNSVDAAQEKHVPVAERACDGKLFVEVGSVPHPMTEEHHISWIAVVQGQTTQRVILDKTSQPSASFCVGDEPLTVYAYCNLHGLWMAELS